MPAGKQDLQIERLVSDEIERRPVEGGEDITRNGGG